jgi:hypothetical protein
MNVVHSTVNHELRQYRLASRIFPTIAQLAIARIIISACGALLPIPCACLAQESASGGVEIIGVDLVPHQFSQELRWRRPPAPELGALVRLYVRNSGPRTNNNPAVELLTTRFNGRQPGDLIAEREWAWFDTPDNRESGTADRTLAPGHLDVWTINAITPGWGPDKTIEVEINTRQAEGGDSRHTMTVLLEKPPVTLSRVFFHDVDHDGYVDACTAHITNDSAVAMRFDGLRIWSPGDDGQSIHNLMPGELMTTHSFTPVNGVIEAGERGVLEAKLGRLPLARGVVELQMRGPDGRLQSCWGHLRFKDDAFAIGAGWLDIASKPGITPVTREAYLQMLKRMHLDTAHIGEIGGYTDQTDPAGLYTRYPLKLMSGLEDIVRYSVPQWTHRIHGVDILGEPQMGKKPQEAHKILRRYERASYPTTVTLSEEKGFRYYAGLSDYPHFDAYRVNAPAADSWGMYERWGGASIRWGAPLEGIGEMTRTLRVLSRPAPIAIWSQNAHEGWGGYAGRKRRSPTVDEIRIQAYEGLANGITGLYWYSLQSWSTLKFRDTITETTRIGREIRMLDAIYSRADAYRHERRSEDKQPQWDVSSLVSADTALLFAIDLAYYPDSEERVFRFRGPRELEAEYELPAYLRPPVDVFRIDADGLHEVTYQSTARGVLVRDKIDRVGIYVAAKRPESRNELARRHQSLLAEEAKYGADPGQDDEAFRRLLNELGYDSLDEIGRKVR